MSAGKERTQSFLALGRKLSLSTEPASWGHGGTIWRLNSAAILERIPNPYMEENSSKPHGMDTHLRNPGTGRIIRRCPTAFSSLMNSARNVRLANSPGSPTQRRFASPKGSESRAKLCRQQ